MTMKRAQNPARHSVSAQWLWLAVVLAVVILSSQQLRARRVYEVAKPTENIRSTPEGLRLGVLEKGTQIDEVGRDGQWVKFEMVAWIWGPSLEGFEEDSPGIDAPERASNAATEAAGVEKRAAGGARQPRQALNVHLNEVRDLVDEDFGRFYGLGLNPESGSVTLRFRVPDIGERTLWQRQMRAQARIDSILATDVDYTQVRIETNRPDGTGSVGQYVAVADTAMIRRIGALNLDTWLESARRSDDGGETWK